MTTVYALAARTGRAVVLWAQGHTRWNPPGFCLQFTRTAQGSDAVESTANASWEACPPALRHKSHYPPPGVSVHFHHVGRLGDAGHVGPSAGDGLMFSTDWPTSGHVSEVPIGTVDREWFGGVGYLGWTEVTSGRRTWVPPATLIHADQLRHALKGTGRPKVVGGRVFKLELAKVVGKGLMSTRGDRIGHYARKRARRLDALWNGPAADGILSRPDIRRLGYRRNGYRTTI